MRSLTLVRRRLRCFATAFRRHWSEQYFDLPYAWYGVPHTSQCFWPGARDARARLCGLAPIQHRGAVHCEHGNDLYRRYSSRQG